MFANFIYFIVALLIYSASPTPESLNFSPIQTLLLFLLLTVVFANFSHYQFSRILKDADNQHRYYLDHRFQRLLTRHAVVALTVFAVDIYGLNLQAFTGRLPLFVKLPTLEAICYLLIFTSYIAIVWANAYPTYRYLSNIEIKRAAYVLSNISFSIPVLLPWIILSGVSDLIMLLPFEWPKAFLETTSGQVVYFLIFLTLIAVLSPLLIQRFWGCKPLEPGIYRARIEALCRKADVQYSNILYWPIFGGRMITAGVMGIFHRFRYILVTRALLNTLEADELDAVIGHEIGHVKKRHLLYYIFFFSGLAFFLFSATPLFNWVVWIIGIRDASTSYFLISIFNIAVFIIYFRYVFGYFMRNFERQADVYVYSLFQDARPLISTFRKIAMLSGQPSDKPNWHHFSLQERVDYLEKCEQDKRWIDYQNSKIRKSIGIYLAALSLLFFTGYQLVYGGLGNSVSLFLMERHLDKVLSEQEPNADLYLELGQIYYNHNKFDEAIRYFQASLELAPSNPFTLNNLAWLYATCKDTAYRDIKAALILSEKAVSITPDSPEFLDTYAESLYLNGYYQEAVRHASKALELASTHRHFYEKQLKKFRKALDRS